MNRLNFFLQYQFNRIEINKHKNELAKIVGARFKGLVWDFD